MGKPLSGFNQWEAITGQGSDETNGVVRNELVVGRSSYRFAPEEQEMVAMSDPRGAYIYDGWKIVIGDRCGSV